MLIEIHINRVDGLYHKVRTIDEVDYNRIIDFYKTRPNFRIMRLEIVLKQAQKPLTSGVEVLD